MSDEDQYSLRQDIGDKTLDFTGTTIGTAAVGSYAVQESPQEYQDILNEGLSSVSGPEEAAAVAMGFGALVFGNRALENGREVYDDVSEYLEG